MAAPPRLKGLRVEDFKDAPAALQPVLSKLFGLLNPFLTTTSTALDRALTFTDNHVAGYFTQVVKAPALAWVSVATSGSVDPVFKNSWYNYDTSVFFSAKYRITPDGWVEHMGLVKHDTNLVGDTTIYTVPAGYRPERQVIFDTSGNGDIYAQARVLTTGDVIWHAGPATGPTWICLDGLRYPATAPAAQSPLVGPGWPIKLNHGLAATPKMVQLVRAEDLGGTGNYSHAAGAVDWTTDAQGHVLIRRVTGLTPERTYRLTFLVAV